MNAPRPIYLFPEDRAVLLELIRRVETLDQMAALDVTAWQLRRIGEALVEHEC